MGRPVTDNDCSHTSSQERFTKGCSSVEMLVVPLRTPMFTVSEGFLQTCTFCAADLNCTKNHVYTMPCLMHGYCS